MNARRPIALTLCAALLVAAPAAATASGASVAAKKNCKKVKGKKRCKPAKKKAVSKVPADGTYNSGDGVVNINISTRAGRRILQVRVKIPLTCTPSGVTQPRTLAITNVPLAGTGFQGKSTDPYSGETTVSGSFLSAARVQLKAQTTGYPNGTEICGGSVDVTANIKKGY